MKYVWLFILMSLYTVHGQTSSTNQNQSDAITSNDSIKNADFRKQLGNGYFPTKYFNFDLRYLIKYNQFEGVRTGIGGVTSETFSESFRIQGYSVYGFLDHTFKYSIGGGFRLAKRSNTWVNFIYTSDLEETGGSVFLTDSRFFQLFEPRLINISLFHRHISKTIGIEHQLNSTLLTETQFSLRKIDPTYNYTYNLNGDSFSQYDLSLLTLSLQWDPFSSYVYEDDEIKEKRTGYPRFSIQYTKSFKGFIGSDFSFSKFDFRAVQQFNHKSSALTEVVFTSGLASGDIPISHAYHAYPNNVNKETIMNRFSVAGINSFETMYFNEFFSNQFMTLILRHKLKPFKISPKFKPQLVLLTKLAYGDMKHSTRHQGLTFSKLNKGFSESGIELNKLLFGFGLSFAYRYGAYHLPKFEDNIAFKFTFNLTLD